IIVCSSSTSQRRSDWTWTTSTTRPIVWNTRSRRNSSSGSTRRSAIRRTTRTGIRFPMRISSGLLTSPAEEPPLERSEQLLADERLDFDGPAVALQDAHVVLEDVVRLLQRVVEFVPLEHVLVLPGLVRRPEMRVD